MPLIANCIATWRNSVLYYHPFVATVAVCLLPLVSVLHQYPFIGYESVFAGLSVSVHWFIAYLLVLWYYNQAAYAIAVMCLLCFVLV